MEEEPAWRTHCCLSVIGRMSSIPAQWMTGQKIDGVAGAEYRGRLCQMQQTDPEVKAERSFQSL